jgi:branched-chain amino acid transport system permease protein
LVANILINGLIFGGMYAVLASGFALVFGVARILNMAHTAFYMVAAFCIYSLTSILGINPWISSLIGVGLATGLAMISYILCIDRVKQHESTVMVITIAIAMIIQESLLLTFRGQYRGINPFIPGYAEIFGTHITNQHILTIITGLIAIGLIWIVLYRTKLGSAVRAVSQDREAAGLTGINVGRVILLAVGISAAFAGVAGAVVAPMVTVYPLMWQPPLIMILAAVVLGGLGSLKGSIIGAFILGFVESAVVFLIPMGGFLKEAVALSVMLLVLIFRSEGLFGIVFEEERL